MTLALTLTALATLPSRVSGAVQASDGLSVSCDPTDAAKCRCSDGEPIGPHTWTEPAYMKGPKSIYNTTVLMEGAYVPLSKYRAKATLIINVASAWGLQNVNYPGLKVLLNKYSSMGFTVLAFPCNQFGSQAPGSPSCERAYMYHKLDGVKNFPIFDKMEANGPGEIELYAVLKAGTAGKGPPYELGWNYEKFLVDGDGVPVGRYSSTDSPLVAEDDIRGLLGL